MGCILVLSFSSSCEYSQNDPRWQQGHRRQRQVARRGTAAGLSLGALKWQGRVEQAWTCLRQNPQAGFLREAATAGGAELPLCNKAPHTVRSTLPCLFFMLLVILLVPAPALRCQP